MKKKIVFWVTYCLSEILIANLLYVAKISSDVSFLFGNLYMIFGLAFYYLKVL